MNDKELNSLDIEVKRMMLNFPSLFQTRMNCLEFMFCTNGTGYMWQPDGTLSDYDGDGTPSIPKHIKPPESRNYGFNDGFLEKSDSLRMEYEVLVRGFREKHIDILCKYNDVTYENMSLDDVYPMSWDFCNMGFAADNPYKIDVVWRDGIREFINWYLPKVNQKYRCYDDIEMINDPTIKNNYKICKKVLRIMNTDEDYKSIKRIRKIHKKILNKLNRELDNE